MEILRMVADKVIGVDDAERLLRALDEGDRKRSEPRRTPSAMAGAFDGVGEALGAIGQVVQSTVEEAMEGVDVDLHVLDPEDDDEGVDIAQPEFDIPEGGQLSIRQHHRAGRPTECSLLLLPAEGGRCTLEAGEGAELRTRRRGDRTRVQWRRGPLTVRVPITVSEVDARVLGGELVARDLACALQARVMGGRMELGGLHHPFDVKTMGGELLLKLAAGLTGSSRIRTMGGNAVLAVPEGLAARITAVTTGGEVRADSGLGRIWREGSRIHRRTVIELGLDGGEAAEISLKTVGGDVVVKRDQP